MEKYRLKLYILDIYIDSWIFENDKFEKKRYLARDIHISWMDRQLNARYLDI